MPVPTSTPRRLLTAALTVAVVTGLPTANAPTVAAKKITMTDARDAPARSDIVSATYANNETRVVTTVRFRDLKNAGTLRVSYGIPYSDAIYDATVQVRRNGKLARRLTYNTNVSTTVAPCNFEASWSARKNVVTVSMPHSCLDFGRFMKRYWIATKFGSGKATDSGPERIVRRGDTPGCATAAEIRKVRVGRTKAQVHANLDTAGRFGDGGAGGYSRVYANCGGGGGWFVEYDGWTGTVIGKGRVGH
jgi:hypothetical protein